MSKLVLHSGEDISIAAERFITAWERAERGEALAAAGLIDRQSGAIRADYAEIQTAIAL